MWDMIWFLLVFRPGIISMTNEWQQGKGNYYWWNHPKEYSIFNWSLQLPAKNMICHILMYSKTIFQTEAIAFKWKWTFSSCDQIKFLLRSRRVYKYYCNGWGNYVIYFDAFNHSVQWNINRKIDYTSILLLLLYNGVENVIQRPNNLKEK